MKDINKFVDSRCLVIQGELKHMLSSLLERSSNKIKLDRVLVESEEDTSLITEENEVQETVRSHFMKKFRKRKIGNNRNKDEWKKAYEPLEEVDENIYKDLNATITIQEWQEVLQVMKSKSSPGLSGISYPLIKRTGKFTQEIFLRLANKCIEKE
jgi:ribosomal protein L21